MNDLISALTNAASAVSTAKADADTRAADLAAATAADATAKDTLTNSVTAFDAAVTNFKAAL